MKKQIIITLLIISTSTWLECKVKEEHKFKLKSPIIGMLDGKALGISPRVVGLMLQVRREVRKMLYGVPVPTSDSCIGTYEFHGQKHSVLSLAKLESELNARFFAHENTMMQDSIAHTPQEWEIIQKKYEKQKTELKKELVHIKEEFKKTTKSYVEGARGFKQQMLILINESCELRNKKDCFLLTWSEAEEGRETEQLDNKMNTFEAFAEFLTDLTHFLEDLVNSCDKAREQFMAEVHHNKAKDK